MTASMCPCNQSDTREWQPYALVNLVQNHIDVWPFLEAVSAEEVPDYYDVVKDAVCMDVIKERVDSGGGCTSQIQLDP
jgi:hypothetical protein